MKGPAPGPTLDRRRLPSPSASSTGWRRLRALPPVALLLCSVGPPAGWSWDAQASGTTSDLRGVRAVSDHIAWASGTRGTFLRTADGGKSWSARVVPGADGLDFRDVEAFDGEDVWLMSAGEGALSRVERSRDGGAHWSLALQNSEPKGFYDAIALWDRRRGLVLGDPVDGRFVVEITNDGGGHWRRTEPSAMPAALPGEGAFAASGTCLIVGPHDRAWFGTGGGGTARVFRSKDGGRTWSVGATPLPAATPSSGIFSLAFWDDSHGIAVGGDYRTPRGGSFIARTSDAGESWTSVIPAPPLDRFLSAVTVVPGSRPPILIAVGPEISAWSSDGGTNWSASNEGYNALSFAGGGAGWAVGPAGRVGRFPTSISSAWPR